MRSSTTIVKPVLGLLLLMVAARPMGAAAQTDDATYCAELGRLALRYTGSAGISGRMVPSLQTLDAVIDCNAGNTAKGIPVLERMLRANGFTLPKR